VLVEQVVMLVLLEHQVPQVMLVIQETTVPEEQVVMLVLLEHQVP
jgi:hypothetical protein